MSGIYTANLDKPRVLAEVSGLARRLYEMSGRDARELFTHETDARCWDAAVVAYFKVMAEETLNIATRH